MNRDAIPEETQGSTKSLPKRGHQLLVGRQSPVGSLDRNRRMQKKSLLSHNSSSDSDSDKEHGKLMKQKKPKKNFSLGDSDDDDDEQRGPLT